ILVLDADERLAPGAGQALLRAIAGGGFACGLLPLHNADRLDATAGDILSGAARMGVPVALPRLLRRDAELRWWGAIHETVGPWVAAGRAVAMVPAPIVHFGAVPSLRDARDKGTRNRALLERHLARQPDDAWARAYLAWELLDAGALDRASREAARAWHDAVEARSGPDPLGRARDLSQAATLRAFTQLQHGDPRGALATVQEALRLQVDHPNLAILQGAAQDTLGDAPAEALDDAIAGLVAARARDGEILPTTPIPGATSWGAATLEAGLRIQRGEPDSALALLDAALQERPDHEPAVLAGAEAFLQRQAGAAALQAVEPVLSSDTPDAWTIAARAAHAAGEPATATALARKARDAERRGWSATRRRGDLARLEAALRAHRTLERLVGAPPPPAADPAAATEAAAAALADGDPATAVAQAASAIAGDVARATAWAVFGAALRSAGLAAPAEQALETALALDPHSGFARTAIARCLLERGEVGLAARHLRRAGDIEGLDAIGVHRAAGPEPADLSVVVTTEDPVSLVGLLDALALQDDEAGSFAVHVVGSSGVAAACDDRRPFPIDRHADHGAAFAACAPGLVVLLGADRRPAPDLLGRHRAAHGGVEQVVIGSGGVASLDAASELDSVLDALEGEPAPGGWPDGPPGNASLPHSAIRAAGPRALEGGDLTRLLPALAARGVASIFAAGCRAPRAATPRLDALRGAARATGRALAATADRARSLADMEAALAARTRLEDGAQQARRLAEALGRAAHRRGRPDGEALRARTDAMRTLLTAERAHARAVAAAGRVEPDPPLMDRLTSVVMLNLNGKGHLYGAVQSLRRHSPGPVEL
ncbi:MAG: hypothetical protein VX000_06325, partial [Myxococcota bacterium]|nr:hypothetical protein [Myxococcota bacterium]